MLEDTVANRRPRGTTVVVHEAADGTVTIRANGQDLSTRLYPKDHSCLHPGGVIEHEHLDGVFEWIAAQQQARDAGRLANPKLSRREKQRIRIGAAPRIPASSPA